MNAGGRRLIAVHQVLLRRAIGLLVVLLSLGLQPAPGPVRLALVGDLMLGRNIAARIQRNGGDEEWDRVLADIQPVLAAADLALGNLESPLAVAPLQPADSAQRYWLCAPHAAGRALAAGGLDLLTLANNHSRDCGPQGEQATRAILQSWSLEGVESAGQPFWRVVKGRRLAFLAFDDVSSPLDLPAALAAIRQARAAPALVIVSIHWGLEYQTGPHERQRHLAEQMAQAGASLIWGHHPHVLQRVEWVRGQDQAAPTLVAYSLGNAVFDGIVPPDVRRSAILLVDLDQRGVIGVEALPVEIDPWQAAVHQAEAGAAERILERLGSTIRAYSGESGARFPR